MYLFPLQGDKIVASVYKEETSVVKIRSCNE